MDQLKEAFKGPLKIHCPRAGESLYLQTDACNDGMGAVLYHLRTGGTREVISYTSAEFTPTENAYHSNEKECLAVVRALKEYKHLLNDNCFTVNKVLTWLDKVKDSEGNSPGNEGFADGEKDYDFLALPVSASPDDDVLIVHIDRGTLEDMIRQTQDDAESLPSEPNWKTQNSPLRYIPDCVLRIHVREEAREEVLNFYHTDPLAGYPGMEETLQQIRERNYWPGLRNDASRRNAGCC